MQPSTDAISTPKMGLRPLCTPDTIFSIFDRNLTWKENPNGEGI